MSILNIQTDYESYQQIWAAGNGGKSPFSKSIDASFYQPDSDADKIVPPGTWFGSIPGSNLVRVLPRTTLTAVTSTGAATISVANARKFKATDVLVAIVPLAFATFASTWANADTATFTFGGDYSITHTVSGFTTLTALATAAAVTLNADVWFNRRYIAIADGAIVYFYPLVSGQPTTPLFSVSKSSVGTLTASGTSFTSQLSLGTIATGGINTTTNVITLTGNVDRILPAGYPIGVASSAPIGLLDKPVDLIRGSIQDIGLYTGGSVYESRLDYIDGELKNDPQFSFTYV